MRRVELLCCTKVNLINARGGQTKIGKVIPRSKFIFD